jgi:hypothetical protein
MARWQPAEREARYIKARQAKRPVIVSEGDSWFDYPMYRNIIDRVDDTRRFAIKRLEFSGDTVENMVGSDDNWSGLESLAVVVERERPRFVLFSGGGNDMIGKRLQGAIKPFDGTQTAEWHLDTGAWKELRRKVRKGYERLIETIGPLAPVFAHGYDHFIPMDRGAKYDGWTVTGPWVWPEMRDMPDDLRRAIAMLMIDWFNDMLRDLEDSYGEDGFFAHLDLRGTLSEDQWVNEIHPTEKGFRAITEKYMEQLDLKLTPTIAIHSAVHL